MAPRSVESGSPGMDAMRKAVARADLPPVAVPPVPGGRSLIRTSLTTKNGTRRSRFCYLIVSP